VRDAEVAEIVAGALEGTPSIAVLGDSMATGLLADTAHGAPAPAPALAGLKQAAPTLRDLMVLVGAAQTQRPLLLDDAFDRPQLSAYGGAAAFSHPTRIAQEFANSGAVVRNVARSGARLAGATGRDAAAQLEMLAAAYETGEVPRARYVVFAFGANDLGQTPDAFATSLRQRLQRLIELHPEAVVLLPSIPDVAGPYRALADTAISVLVDKQQLQETYAGDPDSVWLDGLFTPVGRRLIALQLGLDAAATARLLRMVNVRAQRLELQCADVRLPVQQLALLVGLAPETDRATVLDAVSARVGLLNQSIQAVVSEFDAAGAHLVPSPEVASIAPVAAQIAADCFHPGGAGQALLAELTWASLTGTPGAQ
jgi:lysophospholipase L1-like esterase